MNDIVLSTSDIALFNEAVAVVDAGLATFVEVGRAMAVIRNKRLYRQTHATFEAFCKERWEYTRQHANRLIGASVVMDVLEPIGSILPSNEGQARELAKLVDKDGEPDPKKITAIWTGVVESAMTNKEGKPIITANKVKAAVLMANPKAIVQDKGYRPNHKECDRLRMLVVELEALINVPVMNLSPFHLEECANKMKAVLKSNGKDIVCGHRRA